ncbi:MAG: heme lyase CcmF/NrfE family subunit [Gammaproteobacteria bacterium]|jgi:cytochrome c-type biogenesis protein CcmF|nr:heme lyase CcmF/NrfE family subunit [Gammaproteobacteria bacterium]
MIPELGHLALILALLLALAQGTLPLVGARTGSTALMAVAVPAARGQLVFVAASFALLAYAFYTNDFTVKNVAHNSFSQLPPVYRLTATWGSHEGSMLLWVLLLGAWTAAVTVLGRRLPAATLARVLAVLGLVSAGFLAFVLTTSNPFARLFPAPLDGADLNPLLQDAGMVLHPPMLYMGYVGFSVAFAFALAALLEGRLDAGWARWARPWTTAAWVFLTIGIALGSWWAYRELGWGGWWFWDPTENASFMPWLAGTALLHALAVTEKRGQLVSWTLFLSIAAFSLSLLGTFLVRSGVLSSVHAFANDPARGAFILGLLGVVIGGSLLLYAWRFPGAPKAEPFGWLSRESLLLGNGVLLVAALGTVMLGTLYPLFLDALGMGKVSVGPPYFNAVFVPLFAPILFLMGVGPLARWRQASLPELAARLRWAFAVALVLAVALPLLYGGLRVMTSVGLFLGLWVLLSVLVGFAERRRRAGGTLRGAPRGFWGMQVAHAGLAVVVIGITVVSSYEAERDVRMDVGDHVDLAGYRFTFKGATAHTGPNYVADRGAVEVTSPGGETLSLHPEKRKYNATGTGMTEAAVHSTAFGDLYVSMGEFLGGQAWTVRVYHKPFVGWLWAGAALMALGGSVAASDRRYRRRGEASDRLAEGSGDGSPESAS